MCIFSGSARRVPARVVRDFASAVSSYDPYYDESFDEVAGRIAATGSAGKLDITALATWKRSAQGHWLDPFLRTPETVVRATTAGAFARSLTDAQRVAALATLDGFKTGTFAIGSAVLAAWDRKDYGVTDFHARRALKDLFRGCGCTLTDYAGAYLPALRALRDMLNLKAVAGTNWTARSVDIALMRLDMTKATPTGAL